MSDFIKKASLKVGKLSDEELKRIFANIENDFNIVESILNSVDEGFLLVSKDFKVKYSNSFLQQICDNPTKKKNALVSTYFADKELVQFIKDSIAKRLLDNEFYYSFKSSLYGEIEIRVSLLKIMDSDMYLFDFKDFTFFRRLHAEYRRNESLASMTTMAAQVAHEIKNPLASISIYLQLLERSLDKKGKISKEEAKKSLDVISEEVERLNSIAVDFLFAVKPMNINPVICELNPVVQKSIDVAKAEIEASKITLKENLAVALPKLYIDASSIQQCVLNLVRNSIQALDNNKCGEIKIETYLDGNNVKLSVSDNGCGMTEEQMSKIFEPYFTTKASGTGLGLTTIFKIIKEHEGEINVSSVLGEGSEFVITIPVPKSQRFRISQG